VLVAAEMELRRAQAALDGTEAARRRYSAAVAALEQVELFARMLVGNCAEMVS